MKRVKGLFLVTALLLASAPSWAIPFRVEVGGGNLFGSWQLLSFNGSNLVGYFGSNNYDRTFDIETGDYLWSILGGTYGVTRYRVSLNGKVMFSGRSGERYRFKLFANGTVFAVPEPGTLALLGIGLLGVGFSTQRRRLEKKIG